jgi:TetR/AcrR family transcriptional repressor of nem operon
MKVTREQAAANRERVLDVAARLFRERGFSGIGVAELMKGAGLTHGGFYGQFDSKDDLMAQACTRAFEVSREHWQQLAARAPDGPLAAIAAAYLSTAHRDHPGDGCVVAALGAEAARAPGPVRRAITDGVRDLVDQFVRLLPGRSAAARRQKALATFASFVGALVLSRAVDDPAFSKEILAAVQDVEKSLWAGPTPSFGRHD